MNKKQETTRLRGAIDSLEEDWAILVLDDGQRLDWPRARLPAQAKAGMVIVLDLKAANDLNAQQEAATWQGIAERPVQSTEAGQTLPLLVHLGDQTLHWPTAQNVADGDAISVRLQTDIDETKQRRQQIQNLVDDLFG